MAHWQHNTTRSAAGAISDACCMVPTLKYLMGMCTPALMRRRFTNVPCAELASNRYAARVSPLNCSTACNRELDGCSSTMSAQHISSADGHRCNWGGLTPSAAAAPPCTQSAIMQACCRVRLRRTARTIVGGAAKGVERPLRNLAHAHAAAALDLLEAVLDSAGTSTKGVASGCAHLDGTWTFAANSQTVQSLPVKRHTHRECRSTWAAHTPPACVQQAALAEPLAAAHWPALMLHVLCLPLHCLLCALPRLGPLFSAPVQLPDALRRPAAGRSTIWIDWRCSVHMFTGLIHRGTKGSAPLQQPLRLLVPVALAGTTLLQPLPLPPQLSSPSLGLNEHEELRLPSTCTNR
jgi:hypothetical protein